MRTKYQIDDVQVAKMDLTISLTMPVEEWRNLMRQMSHAWPACDLGRHISEALGNISRCTSAVFTD